ncbi:MAG: hypothetical protein ACC628_20515 [Pirellulaceae bacterium]
MVLQRDSEVKIWGWADADEEIRVTCDWADTKESIRTLVGICVAWTGIVSCDALQAAVPTRDIAHGRRQLFLDDQLIAKTVNVTKVPGAIVKHRNNPIVRRDKPWDASRCDLYGSAIDDRKNQRIQLFYAANNVPNGHEDRLAYAESLDRGKTWTKPELDVIPFGSHQRTNLVMLPPARVMHGPCVFRDEHETDPGKRYKLITSSYPDTAYLGIPRIYRHTGEFLYSVDNPKLPPNCGLPGMYVSYSPDGIHWKTPAVRITNMMSDTAQSAFWDATANKYIAYVRARTANGRSAARMQSNDFENWTVPEIVLEGTQAKSIYSLGVTPYEGIYIGTPWIFEPGAEKTDRPVIWPELATSRDGTTWVRPFPNQPFIPCGPAGSPDSRQIRMSSSLVVLADKILLLYGQSERGHQSVDMQVDIGMATMRLDGFAAMTAGEAEGSLLTKPLRFSSGKLYVNADVQPGGYLRAEVIDEKGKVCTGFELAACKEMTGDSIKVPLVWKENSTISNARKKSCQIGFVLRKAKLYSFWIDAE